MLEMVQKHTTTGTGNYETITNLVQRGYEMLKQAKDMSRTFVPPRGERELVPLGSSSETMYPAIVRRISSMERRRPSLDRRWER
jgi:hypothetical protein